MKPVSLLLLAALALSLTGCNTVATRRREMYRPAKGDGPYTKEYRQVRKGEGIFGVSDSYQHGPRPGEGEGLFGISHPTYPKPDLTPNR